jgi:uncharacterized membrane protein YtjA (UPF0391 family)
VALAAQPIAPDAGAPDTGSIASNPVRNPTHQESAMLHYAVVFFVIALIAALFGFGGIAAGAVGIAKVLFVLFAILAIASFLFGLIRK